MLPLRPKFPLLHLGNKLRSHTFDCCDRYPFNRHSAAIGKWLNQEQLCNGINNQAITYYDIAVSIDEEKISSNSQ
jgi:hypothetical protein